MASKRQFLDPITTACRISLLKLIEKCESKTKLRIIDHTVQLVKNSMSERCLLRPLWYGDSREDLCALFPVIIRYIEHHLCPNKTKHSRSLEETTKSHTHASTSGSLMDDMFEEIKPLPSGSDSDLPSDLCHKYLKIIAQYMIDGLHVLEKTYEYDNSVFTLQYFAILLQSGIDGTYSSDMLPPHLKDYISQNLFDVVKIKKLWTDKNIIHIGKLFEECFDAQSKDVPDAVTGYKAAIDTFLAIRDEEFKKMVSQTENA
jgi:hypothetical protein